MDVFRDIPTIKKEIREKHLLTVKERIPFISHLCQPHGIARNLFYKVYSRPIMILCETANICPNDCVICAYGKMTRKKQVMPLPIFKKLLEDYSELGGGYLSLTPKPGEVFSDNLLAERMALIEKYPKIRSVSATTNAVPVDRFSDDQLISLLKPFTKIQVSVYGLNAEEYQIMTRKNNYHRMVEGVHRLMKAAGPDQVKFTFAFRLANQHTATEMEAWINKNFHQNFPFGSADTYMNWAGALDNSRPLPLEGKWRIPVENTESCIIPLSSCLVNPEGSVSFCSCNDYDSCEELKLGNIMENSLARIYSSEKTYNLWHNLPNRCKGCVSRRPLSDLSTYERMFEDPLSFVGA